MDRWEAGTSPVPEWAEDALEMLRARADDEVADWVELLDGRDGPEIIVCDEPDGMPPRWQRMIAWRVLQAVPELRVLGVPGTRPPSSRQGLGAPS